MKRINTDFPFVSDSFMIPYFLENYSYDPKDFEVVKDGLSHTYKLPMGTTLNFNYDFLSLSAFSALMAEGLLQFKSSMICSTV